MYELLVKLLTFYPELFDNFKGTLNKIEDLLAVHPNGSLLPEIKFQVLPEIVSEIKSQIDNIYKDQELPKCKMIGGELLK